MFQNKNEVSSQVSVAAHEDYRSKQTVIAGNQVSLVELEENQAMTFFEEGENQVMAFVDEEENQAKLFSL